MTIMFTTLR